LIIVQRKSKTFNHKGRPFDSFALLSRSGQAVEHGGEQDRRNRAKSPKSRVIGKGKTWPPQIAQIKTFNHRGHEGTQRKSQESTYPWLFSAPPVSVVNGQPCYNNRLPDHGFC
jgi:hypothetical protein